MPPKGSKRAAAPKGGKNNKNDAEAGAAAADAGEDAVRRCRLSTPG